MQSQVSVRLWEIPVRELNSEHAIPHPDDTLAACLTPLGLGLFGTRMIALSLDGVLIVFPGGDWKLLNS